MDKLIRSKAYIKALEYLNQKDYTSAVVYFCETLEEEYVDPEIHYYLAVCYANLKYHKETLEEIESALKSQLNKSKQLQMLLLKGYILTLEDRNQEAIGTFEEILKLYENNISAYSGLGYNYYINKDYDKAVEIFKKGLKIDPSNSNLNNSYGYTLIESDIDINEGIRRCTLALSKTPKNSAVIDSLAWGFFKKGMIRDAVRNIIKAVKLKTKIKTIKEHYSIIVKKAQEKFKKIKRR